MMLLLANSRLFEYIFITLIFSLLRVERTP
jgi:hypothetical protein